MVSPRTFSSVGKNPQEQRTEQRYSWEASSSFVRSFHVKMNKENITCDIQKHPPWAIHFSAARKGKKASSLSSPFFLWCTDGFFNAAKRVHHAQFWHLPEQNQVLASGWENDRNEGQNFLSQAELGSSVCSGTLPFYLYELAVVFHCVGRSPRESISEGNLSRLWWKLSYYLPLLIRLGYMGRMKNAATHKMVRQNPFPNNKTVRQFLFFFCTSHLSELPPSQAAVKPFASKQGRGHLINHFYSHWAPSLVGK